MACISKCWARTCIIWQNLFSCIHSAGCNPNKWAKRCCVTIVHGFGTTHNILTFDAQLVLSIIVVGLTFLVRDHKTFVKWNERWNEAATFASVNQFSLPFLVIPKMPWWQEVPVRISHRNVLLNVQLVFQGPLNKQFVNTVKHPALLCLSLAYGPIKSWWSIQSTDHREPANA